MSDKGYRELSMSDLNSYRCGHPEIGFIMVHWTNRLRTRPEVNSLARRLQRVEFGWRDGFRPSASGFSQLRYMI